MCLGYKLIVVETIWPARLEPSVPFMTLPGVGQLRMDLQALYGCWAFLKNNVKHPFASYGRCF